MAPRRRRPVIGRSSRRASSAVVDVDRRRASSRLVGCVVGRARRSRCRRSVAGWSRSTRPCLNSSSTARKRTTTSSRSTSAVGERAERDAPDRGQLVEQLGDRVGDARPDRRDVVEVDARHRLRARRPAGTRPAGRSAVTPASRSGVRSRKRSSSPATRGNDRPASSARRREHRGGVLERLALEQAGEEQVALLPERQLVVEVDVVAARAAGGGSSARRAWRR